VLSDARVNAMLIGPGAGWGQATCSRVLSALAAGKALVLDADALTAFSENPPSLFDALTGNEILTPHEGEFARLFPSALQEKGKIERARTAAALCGAIVVLKGADTVIAAPDGRAIVNANAPADLGDRRHRRRSRRDDLRIEGSSGASGRSRRHGSLAARSRRSGHWAGAHCRGHTVLPSAR
jgi:hypothetical protein